MSGPTRMTPSHARSGADPGALFAPRRSTPRIPTESPNPNRHHPDDPGRALPAKASQTTTDQSPTQARPCHHDAHRLGIPPRAPKRHHPDEPGRAVPRGRPRATRDQGPTQARCSRHDAQRRASPPRAQTPIATTPTIPAERSRRRPRRPRTIRARPRRVRVTTTLNAARPLREPRSATETVDRPPPHLSHRAPRSGAPQALTPPTTPATPAARSPPRAGGTPPSSARRRWAGCR